MSKRRIELSLDKSKVTLVIFFITLMLLASFISGIALGIRMKGTSLFEKGVNSPTVRMKIGMQQASDVEIEKISAPGTAAMKNISTRPIMTFYETLSGRTEGARRSKKRNETNREPEKAAPKGRQYTIQVGAMKDRVSAEELVSKLKTAGYSAYISNGNHDGSGQWHRVRIGSFSDRKEAEREAEKIRKNEKLQTNMVEK